MASKTILNKSLMQGEKGALAVLEEASKTILFSFVYLMLKDFQNSTPVSLLIMLVQYLQLHYYQFHRNIYRVSALMCIVS